MSTEAQLETPSGTSQGSAADGFCDGDEVRALTRLTFEELARGVSGLGELHGAIATRVFNHVGGAGMARFMHDVISGAVYSSIGGGQGHSAGRPTTLSRCRGRDRSGRCRRLLLEGVDRGDRWADRR